MGLLAVARRSRWLAVATTPFLMAALSTGAVATWAGPKEDWRAAVNYIDEQTRPEDVLVLRSVYYLSMNYYYTGPLKMQALDAGWDLKPPETLAGQRVWLLYRGELAPISNGDQLLQSRFYKAEKDEAVRAWLRTAEPYRVVGRDFSGVVVLLYDFSLKR
jgi:hypothetical protein